jgi:DNA-binding NtrC family response regulator
LVVHEGATSTYPLADGVRVLVGRARNADVRIDHVSVSREHAVFQVDQTKQSVTIEDLGSANGTRVRGTPLTPRLPIEVVPDDVIDLGEILLVIQRRKLEQRSRRACDPAFFELRVEEECQRTADTGSRFAVARVEVDGRPKTPAIQLVLASELRQRDLIASREPGRYELLLVDAGPGESRERLERAVKLLAERGFGARFELVGCPGDGTTAAALLGRGVAEKGAASNRQGGTDFVVHDPAMRRVCRLLERIAGSELGVILLGETGVGKEMCAELVHACSARAGRKLLRLNCAALAESLLESELFGYERGAFTGATSDKIGLLESADGGTVFLDEVGDMPLATQVKLLRAIEAKEVLRIGARAARSVDLRVIAATNQDLEERITQGLFREDLYYRLNGISVIVPPLRERPDDIGPLARHFLTRRTTLGRPTPGLSPASLRWLASQTWPGNVRELKNAIERALVLCDGPLLEPEHFTFDSGSSARTPSGAAETGLRKEVEALERERIERALSEAGGNQRQAAEKLGLSRGALLRRLEQYGIARPRKGA